MCGVIDVFEWIKNAFVVVVNGLLSVIHAAVADFDCVMITDSSKFVVFQEVLVYYGKESVSDIGADIFA